MTNTEKTLEPQGKVSRSANESGHRKNLAHFEMLLGFVENFGDEYKPVPAALQLAALAQQLVAAKATLETFRTALYEHNKVTNTRETLFKDLKKLSTRVVSALKTFGVEENVLNDVLTIQSRMQGKRVNVQKAKQKVEAARQRAMAFAEKNAGMAAEPEAVLNSVSQQSFDSLLSHLADLITALGTIAAYKPNEKELTVEGLKAYHKMMEEANTNITPSAARLNAARTERNNALYAPGTGIVDTANTIKAYVKSRFGTRSPRYKQVARIKFYKRQSN